jgi:hypothetical protein
MPKNPTALIGLLLLASLTAFAQSTLPKLEVASIKELSSDDSRTYLECGAARLNISGNRISMTKITACGLINMAYTVQEYEVVNAPKWTKDGWPLVFELQALAEGSEVLTFERARELLQVMLVERFHLHYHKETREMPVYALVVGRDGAKFVAICRPAPIVGLARTLTMQLDRPVLDRTGLKDNYRYELTWEDRSTMFSSLEKQLGLQLIARNEPVEVMVIDRIERPAAN